MLLASGAAMRRRSKTSGKAIKTQRRRTFAPKAARDRRSPAGGKETNVAQLTRERDESLEQQAATADVLKVISRSVFDLQSVLDRLIESAAKLCDADMGGIVRPQEGHFQFAGNYRMSQEFADLVAVTPISSGRGTLAGRVIMTGRIVHIPDALSDSEYTFKSGQKIVGYRTGLGVPLMREGTPIGVVILWRSQVRPFTDRQIQLVATYADQAVIAIENARLLNELRQRTDDLTESLEQQTATSEVLRIISSSPGELEPVFNTILANATRICEAKFGLLYRSEGDVLRTVAMHGAPPALVKERQRDPIVRPAPATGLGQALAARQPVQIADILKRPEYFNVPAGYTGANFARLSGARTVLGVPMLKDNELVGAITIFRKEVRPFTDKQIELVKNFAAQAVIAIENTRLLNELRQRTTDLTVSLDQQIATSEVLSIISSSPAKLEPVFQAILANATQLCDAKFGTLGLYDGEVFHSEAAYNVPPEYAEARLRHVVWRPPPRSGSAEVVRTKRPVLINDLSISPQYLEGDPQYLEGNSMIRATVDIGGARTLLLVPMLKDDQLVGMIGIYRKEVRPFTDKQIELVKNFAAQAVIAIENARLLNELREALDQQTATSEVLKVISSSPSELKPVFDAILEHATRICEAKFGTMWLREGDAIRVVALHNAPPAFEERRRNRLIHLFDLHPKGAFRRSLETRQVIHIADLRLEQGYLAGAPHTRDVVDAAGARTGLIVPMLKGNDLVGSITIYRQEVRPFTDKQIELVQNFAAQAVIAIENARLLNDLNKLNQQLEQRVTDQVSEIERMGRLRRFLPPQVADLIVASGAEKQLESHRREITALFCDLRGFTGFSESSDPEDVMSLLRQYHAAIGEIIIKYSGTLEHYAGDGVMVFFNDPIPVPKSRTAGGADGA